MERHKFACYIGLMTVCSAAFGLFLPFLCFLILGHTTLAVPMRWGRVNITSRIF
jgi:hypothetical protein